ncbi:type II toxin-antitoxin system HicB family antitoxin [Aliarcobacter cryaerophilus]|uniref:type II toxin-antitoxin system HicB family antitoxin n=1 Tax=Aliarcobacter cryaerophilus TaxID=28198 RepID=UPI00164A3A3A|nr:type II toxin-antitoxin system HicB family antitoxin [Aliarcobacter cryaerophilus]QNK85950.1 type II toxin-antitoxin system HicB family antitoxin [Aliarcobacter cryaerophilus]
MEYIAFIHKESDDYVAVVPDLNFVSSYGSNFIEVVHNIKEASELFCEELETLPKPSSLEKLLELEDIEKDAVPQLIDVKVEKLKRVNVIMRSDILESLKERLVEFNGNRSAYLQNLVIKDLKSHKISIS